MKEYLLNDVLNFYHGKAIKSTDGNVPIYGSNGIIGTTHKSLYKDAIILGRVGAYCGSVERCKGDFWASDNTIVVKSKDDFINDYCYYLLKSIPLNSYAGGAAQPLITQGKLKSLSVKVPCISIQQKIAEILSAYDDLIENNQKQIKLLEEATQRLYKEWFVDLRFPGHENTPIIDGIPEGWGTKTLTDIANIIMGQSPKSEFYNQDGKGLPFHQGVGSYGTRFVIDNTYSTSYTRIAEAGSILFSVRAPVGRLNMTKNKVVIGRGLAAINHRSGKQSYLFYLLKERFFKDDVIGNGAIFASISKDELFGQKFLTPIDELVVRFDAVVIDMDKKISDLADQITLLAEARDRLLPKLMSGEIEV